MCVQTDVFCFSFWVKRTEMLYLGSIADSPLNDTTTDVVTRDVSEDVDE